MTVYDLFGSFGKGMKNGVFLYRPLLCSQNAFNNLLPCPINCSISVQILICYITLSILWYTLFLTLCQREILDSSKLKEFTDNNFKFDENGRKFSRWVENTGKRRNCSSRAISPFPTMFSKDLYCRHIKNQGLFGKGLRAVNFLYSYCFFWTVLFG